MDAVICSIGLETHTECLLHNVEESISASQLTLEQQQMLMERTNISKENLIIVCPHHKKKYLESFEYGGQACCDPLRQHQKIVKKSLRLVTSDMVRKHAAFANLAPGSSICSNCNYKLIQKGKNLPSASSNS